MTTAVWVGLEAGPCLRKGCMRCAGSQTLLVANSKEGLVDVPAEAIVFTSFWAKVQLDVFERPILYASFVSVAIATKSGFWIIDGNVREVGLVRNFIPVAF